MRSYDVAIDVTGRCDLSGQLPAKEDAGAY
jgi:hypothetical protein